MKKHVERLYQSIQKEERLIIGLMSGTSLDGLDIALCRLSGSGIRTQAKIERFITAPYDCKFRAAIKSVFAQREVDLQEVTLLNGWVAEQHAEMVNKALASWGINPDTVDCIASHGQTIYHCPKEQHALPEYGHGTLQIGDGDKLAAKTGIITLSDFRQKHIAAGGEGAPLAVYGDFLVFSDETENRILLNMGGIANFTWLPASGNGKTVFSTDVGPGNTIIDAYISQHFGQLRYDEDGKVAAAGKVSEPLLNELLRHEFFAIPMPKTTGPEVFNLDYLGQARLRSQTLGLSVEDVTATLTAFTARTICDAISEIAKDSPIAVYASGGGVHNPVLMKSITDGLAHAGPVHNLDILDIDPDAKEALLFAVLANENLVGDSVFAMNQYGIPDTSMGKISFP